jgi:hypothetical protein
VVAATRPLCVSRASLEGWSGGPLSPGDHPLAAYYREARQDAVGIIVAANPDEVVEAPEIAEADAWRDEAWAIIRRTPHLTYQILTKRPERMAGRLPWTTEPWPHVWLGASVETPDYYGRIAALQQVPAALRFLSLEPLLAPLPDLPLDGIGWAIIGGESESTRPFDAAWARDLLAQCRAATVPVFLKQMGTAWARAHGGGARDSGGDWSRWPADLRVRQFPARKAETEEGRG